MEHVASSDIEVRESTRDILRRIEHHRRRYLFYSLTEKYQCVLYVVDVVEQSFAPPESHTE